MATVLIFDPSTGQPQKILTNVDPSSYASNPNAVINPSFPSYTNPHLLRLCGGKVITLEGSMKQKLLTIAKNVLKVAPLPVGIVLGYVAHGPISLLIELLRKV